MPQSALSKKLLIKPGDRVVMLSAPEGEEAMLQPLPEGAEVHYGASQGPSDVVLLFADNREELDIYTPALLEEVEPGGILWIAYPKQSSKIKTDINQDSGWETINAIGWRGIARVSIDETWSAIRFRPEAEIR